MSQEIFFSFVAIITSALGVYFYIRDIFLKKTEPHIYTWLVWLVTASIATAGAMRGGGGIVVSSMVFGTLNVAITFLLSIKFGTKNIKISDTIALLLAFLAILVWVMLDEPLLAVFMVTGIDLIGYIPSLRKTYEEPWSETLFSWVLYTIAPLATILGLVEYNLLTMTYLVAVCIINSIFCLLCYWRRRVVPRPYN